jgi:hypothetical protein
MVMRARVLAFIGTAILLSACDSGSKIATANKQNDPLPATVTQKDFGNYVLYFNAINTNQLTPDIAKQYGIVRSKSQAMLNVSIHKKSQGGGTEAVTGAVTASAVNLNAQLKSMTLREIREDKAIYYIGELPVTDGEVLVYTIDAKPSDDPSRLTVRFQKQFYVEQ